ncbi:hypothetical protein HPB50_023462 [Hyalomma asiaticum]|uniref:Uncharacterized protein n=1 Tax=Hyalomma asiaticum TaxID=266040 RepID=A0ACB7TQF1_HYAAI|nr:hypothetical protein HPB50_023462 [Hyalomma asiaticum]
MPATPHAQQRGRPEGSEPGPFLQPLHAYKLRKAAVGALLLQHEEDDAGSDGARRAFIGPFPPPFGFTARQRRLLPPRREVAAGSAGREWKSLVLFLAAA